MSPFLISSLPVIHHETGHFLFSGIYLLAAFTVIIIYMVAGYSKKVPLSQLLLGAATFFLFFTIGSKLVAFTSGEWHQLLAHGAWPRAEKKMMLGGLTGLFAAILLYASWTRNSKRIFDIVAIVLPVGMSIQRIACLLSGCCSGVPTCLPWGIRYDQHTDVWSSQVISGQITAANPCSLPVHPTQVYDIIVWVIIFFLSARAARYFRASGSRLLLTILLYGFFRFLLEFLRDPLYDFIPGSYWGIKYIQWMILAGLPLPALVIMARERRAGKAFLPEVPEEEKFARHFILTLLIVSRFLMLRPLFNLQEMIALSLLLVSLFILTAIQVFRRNPVPGFRLGICLFILFFLAVSCANSRFATTTRHYHDGKVTYTNQYSRERKNLNWHKKKRPATLPLDASAKTGRNPVDNQDTINKMNLIASSTNNFLVLNDMKGLISQNTPSPYQEVIKEKELTQLKHPWNTLTKDHATASLKEIYQRDSTTVKKRDNTKENAAGTEKTNKRKTEKLGLVGFIFSFLGIIPLIGIPFAVLAITFGAKSLKKIKRNPEKYKGKGFATASIVIGCAMIVMNILYLVISIEAVNNTPAPHVDTSSSGSCRA
jgi:hypothetical protein